MNELEGIETINLRDLYPISVCHVTTDMWKTVVEEHCLENPNLVLQPAEISSVVTSLLQAVAQVSMTFI